MRPLTYQIPKSLIEFHAYPFVHYQLTYLSRQHINEVVFSVGYLGERIKDYVGSGSQWNLIVSYVDEGKTLLGTAGAIRLAIDSGIMQDGFFVMYGDSYLPIEFNNIWHAADQGQIPVMTVFRNEGKFDSSNVIFKNQQILLYEKGRTDFRDIDMHFIDYGLSVIPKSVIKELVPSGKTMDLAEVFNRLSIANQLKGYEVFSRFYEVGTQKGCEDFEKYLINLDHTK